MSKKILITNKYDISPLEIVKRHIPDGFELLLLDSNDRTELISKAADADFFLVSGRNRIDSDVIENAPKLRMIQRTGVGTEMIDLNVLTEKGIPLYVNRGINSQSVAEHTILLMLASLRQLTRIDTEVRSGVWKKQANGVLTHELKGKTIGLIGLGAIGLKVSEIAKAFGACVTYYDICRLDANREADLGLKYLGFDELISTADIISLHCPLTQSNHDMLSSREFDMMKDTCIVVNTARGKLINEHDLFQALKTGSIAAAALDVYYDEPVNGDCELLSLSNIITTPHIGGITEESFSSMISSAMKNIEAFENGHTEEIEKNKVQLL